MSQSGLYGQLAGHGAAIGWDEEKGIAISYFLEGALGVSGSAWGTFYIDPRNLDFIDDDNNNSVVSTGGSLYLGAGTPIGTPAVAFQIQKNQETGEMFLTLGTGVESYFEVGFYSEGNNGWDVTTMTAYDYQFQSDGVAILSETTVSENGYTLINTYAVDSDGNRLTPVDARGYLEQAGYSVAPNGSVYSIFKSSSDGTITKEEGCFLAGTPITMADGTTKPIEEMKVGDEVQSYNKEGDPVHGTVSNTFVHDAKYVLDFFGTGVTPGHVFLCGDGKFDDQHVPLMDILRSDGAVVLADGSSKRAASMEEVGSMRDRTFVWAITGDKAKDGSITIKERKKLRISTRVITENGSDLSLADMIFGMDAIVNQNHLIQASFDSPEEMPFHWTFSEHLPNPEDYVLQRSQLTLNEIYAAGEWEQPPRLPAPVSGESGPSFHNIPLTISASAPPNMPLSLQGRPEAQPTMNRKQRKTLTAQRRKAMKRSASTREVH